MSWLALLLLGVGAADLAATAFARLRWVPVVVGALAILAAVLGAGLLSPADAGAAALAMASVAAWRGVLPQAEQTPALARRALGVLLLPGVALAVLSGFSSPAGGVLAGWLEWVRLPPLSGMGAERFLALVALATANTATANRVVRLVLASVDALRPRRPAHDALLRPADHLRGGRLLGPMERLLILGFGAAGSAEAAALVVAAKGLLRFPELQAAARTSQESVDAVTEYFLIGTFTSLLVALGSVVLLG